MEGTKFSIMSVNVGKPKSLRGLGKGVDTAIEKESVEQEIYLTKLNLTGDEQADKKNHGGEDKAICVYPIDHYPFWEKEIGHDLPPGGFGENLTVEGLLETEANIGDTFQWGGALVQVSQPRMPCHKVARRYNIQEFPQRMIETGFTGFYMRVLKEGKVSVKTPLTFMERCSDVSVALVNNTFYHDKSNEEAIQKILGVKELASVWKAQFERLTSWR